MYSFDLYKLLTWLVPVWLRHSNFMLLMRAMIYPIKQVYDKMVTYRIQVLYRINHNCQVCYFQKVLNDRFDAIDRRIRIVDFAGRDRIYFYSDAARRDVYFGTKYFWPEDAYHDSGVDFTVQIPTAVATTYYDFELLKSLIAEYRLAGKAYNIVRI